MPELTKRQKELLEQRSSRSNGMTARQRELLSQSDVSVAERAEPVGMDKFARMTGEPFNRGLAQTLQAPTDVLNAGLHGGAGLLDATMQDAFSEFSQAGLVGGPAPERVEAPQIPANVEGGFRSLGLTAPPEQQETGMVPRAFEILGGSVAPGGALMAGGRNVLAREATRASVPATRSAAANVAAETAKRPGLAAATDTGTSFTSAAGGAVAQNFTDDPTIIALGELAGGFSPAAAAGSVSVASKTPVVGSLARKAGGSIVEHLAPFTNEGGRIRAAKRLQSLAGDPAEVAARVGKDAKAPAVVQAGDRNLAALHREILRRNPHMDKGFSESLKRAQKDLLDELSFGGDKDAAIDILNVRARQAAEEAAAAIDRLGPNATPRQISAAARSSLESALSDARKQESAIWNSLDQRAPADITNARRAFGEEIAGRSPDADPEDIPGWLKRTLGDEEVDASLMKSLEQRGMLDAQGQIPDKLRAALQEQGLLEGRQRQFKDVRTIRTRVQREIREELAKDAPNRNKVRILSDIETALLDDLTETGVEGVQQARAFSHALNDKFTRGRVGQLLGRDRPGGSSVPPEDTLSDLIYGRHSASSVQQFIETSSDAPEQVLDFIKASYLQSVAENQTINPAAHKRFMDNLRKKGLFEVFPELEGQLNTVTDKVQGARLLNVDPNKVGSPALSDDQARAAVYLQGLPGEEMSNLLRARNPAAAARDLVSRVGNDESALRGLKSAFSDEMAKQARGARDPETGERLINGASLKEIIRENAGTARALGMSDADIDRMMTVAEKLRLWQLSPSQTKFTDIVDDKPIKPLDLIARFIGARAGGNLGDDMGSRLVLAQFLSKNARDTLLKLTRNKAEDLIMQAMDDPALMKALLTGPTESTGAQRRAAKSLERAIMRSGVAGSRIIGTGATQDEGEQ